MLQKWCNNFHSNCWNFFWTLSKCPLRFVTLDYTKKKAKIFFSVEILPFFSKICFQQPLEFLKFDLITSAVKLKLPRGLLQSVLWDLSYSITRFYEKKRPKSFFHWKDCLFFSKLCVFKQPLRCYKIDLISSRVNVGLPFGPLPIVFWGLSHSIIREKTGQLFVTGQKAFFEKVVLKILGPKETII